MPVLVPVAYRAYPPHLKPLVREVAGHLGRDTIAPNGEYTLHTEYSAGRRELSQVAARHAELGGRLWRGIPQLWYDRAWASAFAAYLLDLVGQHRPPRVIEVHPPFADYCPSISQFLDTYAVFERAILAAFPNTMIVLENRCGTLYRFAGQPAHGPFLVATADQVVDLCVNLARTPLKLGIALDIPQIFSAHLATPATMTPAFVRSALAPLHAIRHRIYGVHLWGKRVVGGRFKQPHQGNLDTYLGHEPGLKSLFLRELHDLLNDGQRRYFLAETMSDADSVAIVTDLAGAGFTFDPAGSAP